MMDTAPAPIFDHRFSLCLPPSLPRRPVDPVAAGLAAAPAEAASFDTAEQAVLAILATAGEAN